jgi:hypothetical protein
VTHEPTHVRWCWAGHKIDRWIDTKLSKLTAFRHEAAYEEAAARGLTRSTFIACAALEKIRRGARHYPENDTLRQIDNVTL